MRAEVTPALLLFAAKETNFPAVRLGAVTLADEGAWRYALARATPGERVQLLLALEPELLTVTPGGFKRLQAQTERARDVDDEPTFYGDSELLETVRAALALVPAVVRWAIQREVAFLSIVTSRGWTGSALFLDAAGHQKMRIIVLGATADLESCLHEMAHAFCSPTVDAAERWPLITTQGEEGLRALAARQGWAHRIDAHMSRDEKLAVALALAWLYAEPDTKQRAS